MTHAIDIEALMAPLPGDKPTGENLRYTATYEEIQEARRADDPLDRGDWQREIKTADWDKVIALGAAALRDQTKDLQIGAWLVEALTAREGFKGLDTGLRLMTALLRDFWEAVYPQIEDDDLDYRIGPLEFLNDKLWLYIKQIPVTDAGTTPGYGWVQWQESRQVGSEEDTRNQYGDVDEGKKAARDEMIAEGKLSAEEFDAAVARSTKSFYAARYEELTACLEAFGQLDQVVDDNFGKEAPRLSELKGALEDCDQLLSKILKAKQAEEPDVEDDAVADDMEVPAGEAAPAAPSETEAAPVNDAAGKPAAVGGAYRVNRLLGSAGVEEAVWREALAKLKTAGINQALEHLLGATCSAQSMREKTNFRLLLAKLCLKADRPDLARPIAEQLNALIEELQLERWESPIWIAEVLDTLYQCLMVEGAPDDDYYRAEGLMTKICTLDVTKAMARKR